MNDLITRIMAWQHSRDRGATAVEYALIVALVAAAIAAITFALGSHVKAGIQAGCTALNSGNPC